MASSSQPLSVNTHDNSTANITINNYHFHGPPSPGGPPHLVQAYASKHPEWVQERKRKWEEQNQYSDCSSDSENESGDDEEQILTSSEQMQLFDSEELFYIARVKRHGKVHDCIVSQLVEDPINGGVKLMGGCKNICKNQFVDLQKEFMPRDNLKNVRRRPLFLAAMYNFQIACRKGHVKEARKFRFEVDKLRSGHCQRCMQTDNDCQRVGQQACKRFFEQKRLEACIQNNGCYYADCVERGIEALPVLEGDHIHGKNHADHSLRKLNNLSDYVWWSWNGGVEGMTREIAKGVQWPCAFCHMGRDNCSSSQRYKHLNWESMPNGSRSKHATAEEKQRSRDKDAAMRRATISYPKMKYVDKIKRRVLQHCDYCRRGVVIGFEQRFHFDHIDETTKLRGKHTLACKNGGVGGLVGNANTNATLELIKSVIDEEIAKCRLLCINCHRRKTNHIIRFNVQKNAYEKAV